MPEELAVIIVLFIVLVLAPRGVFLGIKSLRESKASTSSTGSSLRRSDLQAMIDEAVTEATAPLVERIDELERDLLLGGGRISPDAMEDAFGDDGYDEEAQTRPIRQRT